MAILFILSNIFIAVNYYRNLKSVLISQPSCQSNQKTDIESNFSFSKEGFIISPGELDKSAAAIVKRPGLSHPALSISVALGERITEKMGAGLFVAGFR